MKRQQKLSAWADALRALRREQIANDPRSNPFAWSPGPRRDDDLLANVPALYLSERLH